MSRQPSLPLLPGRRARANIMGMPTSSPMVGFALALVATLSLGAQAPASHPDSLVPPSGSYTYTLLPDSSDDIKKAVNQTVEHMSFITRPVARGRLNKTNPTPQIVHVVVSADTFSVTLDNGNPVATPFNGDSVPYHSLITNEDYKARYDPVADTASQAIASKDGVRRNTFMFLDGGQRLRIHVTVTSPRLPGPLNYELLFAKSGS
jgi:hypothetical protein